MTIREQSRIAVLNGIMEGKVSVAEAARLMGVSERHAWRLLRAYRKEGVAGVAHGNRGRMPSTTTCPEIQEKVMELATGAYSGFNHSHLTEMLADGRASICLAPPSGGSFWPGNRKPPSSPSAQALPSKGALPPGGNAAADRREPAQLAGGSRTTSDSHRLRGRRHRDGPLRSVPSAGGRPRLHADAQGDHRSPRSPNGPVQRPA